MDRALAPPWSHLVTTGRDRAVSPDRSLVERSGPAHGPQGAWRTQLDFLQASCLNTQHWPPPTGPAASRAKKSPHYTHPPSSVCPHPHIPQVSPSLKHLPPPQGLGVVESMIYFNPPGTPQPGGAGRKAQRGPETRPSSHSSCVSGGAQIPGYPSVWFQRPFSISLPRFPSLAEAWSSTSGSQMTLPSQERRQRPGVPVAGGGGRGKGAGGRRGGTGGDGQRNWLASFPLAWRPSPGQLGAELPSPLLLASSGRQCASH